MAANELKSVAPAFHVRRGQVEDENLVYSSWLHGMAEDPSRATGKMHASPISQGVSRPLFIAEYRKIVTDLLARSQLLVAESEEPAVVLGYLVFEPSRSETEKTRLHYFFVKKPYRKAGVLRGLLAAAEIDPNVCIGTHMRVETKWIYERWRSLVYDPIHAWRAA